MTHLTTGARTAASALAAALAVSAFTLVSGPAYAADDVTIDGITYESIDPGDAGAGARVTAYADGAAAEVVIDSEVVIDGDPHAVVEVGPYAFEDKGITSVMLPSGLELIDEWAFAGNALVEVDLPDGVQRIYGQAFQGNVLESVRLPAALTVLGRAAFFDNRLESVNLTSSSLTALSSVTFGDNLLTEVWIPASITEIGNDVFTFNPTLEEVTFLGAAPTYTGAASSNLIAQNRASTNPVIRFYEEHLDTFSWPSWEGFATTPLASVRFADPVLGVDVYPNSPDVALDQGTDYPYGFLHSMYDDEFDIEAPEGYELAGWAANGEPYEVGDPITESTLFTPLWLDTTAVWSVVMTPSATEVEEGGSVTVTAEGFNARGESVGDVTADMELSSDVSTDVIDGATVTFPTASPHTISGLYLPREIVAEPIVIEVLGAEIDDQPEPVDPSEPTVPSEPTDPTEPGDETSDEVTPAPAAPASRDALPVAVLAESGPEDHRGLTFGAIALTGFGAALIAVRRRIG